MVRIVTRPDFDGIVCAVLLRDAVHIENPILWVEPGDMQKGRVDIQPGDIIANLPYHTDCSLWFDHHESNRVDHPIDGSFEIAPSAAGIVYRYYQNQLKGDYRELIEETDRIDSGDLLLEEILYPDKNPYVLVSISVSGRENSDEKYWNTLVRLLGKYPIKEIIAGPDVKPRVHQVIKENETYRARLKQYTRLKKNVAVTDFRELNPPPSGNRFLIYSMYPQATVQVKIRHNKDDRNKISISVGHSIFNRKCKINIGRMLSDFEGGGHFGAGGCTFHKSKADIYIPKIIDILMADSAD
jgi:oligoribonuclease NrnB/cAMP/cGMP phosphodiesterase (DHH superfamily)